MDVDEAIRTRPRPLSPYQNSSSRRSRPSSDPYAHLPHRSHTPLSASVPAASSAATLVPSLSRSETHLAALDASPQAKELARLRAEVKLLREKSYALSNALREASASLRQKDNQVESLRERNRALEHDNDHLRRLSDERKLEMRSMERFLSRNDRWAGSDLVQAVKDINQEILQFAAAASETLVQPPQQQHTAGSSTPRNQSPAPSLGRRKALERVAARFGSKMKQVLENRDHSQDPTILQYALQACVCQCVSHAMSAFCFGSTGKLESHLSKIYSHMHATEPQPTSSRWRALTHAHIRSLSPNIDALATSEVTDTCLRGIANVLSAAGASEPLDALLTRASTLYRAQLRRIAELANRFSFVLREGTMSTDFQPLFVESVREFNTNTMENLYASVHGTGSDAANGSMANGVGRGRVLCTTEIGLQCLTNKGRDGKDFSAQTIERRVVLKPRVVLENIVQMLDPAR